MHSVPLSCSVRQTAAFAVFLVLYLFPAISPVFAQSLRSPDNSCDYLIITHKALMEQAVRLAAFRDSFPGDDVDNAMVVNIDSVYAEFPHDSLKSGSILGFMKYVAASWTGRPRYVVLFGEADEVDSSGLNMVPSVLRSVGTGLDPTFYPVDDYYSYLGADSGLIPDGYEFIIGRIPARSPEQAVGYINKVINHESRFAYGPAAFTFCALADDILKQGELSLFNFIGQMDESLGKLTVEPFIQKLYLGEYTADEAFQMPDATEDLFAVLEGGISQLVFAGHSSTHELTHERVFEVGAHQELLPDAPFLPVFFSASYMTNNFISPEIMSVGEAFLFSAGGSIVSIGPAGPGYAGLNHSLQQLYLTELLSGQKSIGEVFYTARAGLPSIQSLILYCLLGDPAVRIRVPVFDMAFNSLTVDSLHKTVSIPDGDFTGRMYYELLHSEQVVYVPSVPDSDMVNPQPYIKYTLVKSDTVDVTNGVGNISLASDTASAIHVVKVMMWNDKSWHYGHFSDSLMTADIGDFRASPGRGMTWLMPARRYTVDGRRAPAGRQGHMLKVKHE